jgi:hypothetical protein
MGPHCTLRTRMISSSRRRRHPCLCSRSRLHSLERRPTGHSLCTSLVCRSPLCAVLVSHKACRGASSLPRLVRRHPLHRQPPHQVDLLPPLPTFTDQARGSCFLPPSSTTVAPASMQPRTVEMAAMCFSLRELLSHVSRPSAHLLLSLHDEESILLDRASHATRGKRSYTSFLHVPPSRQHLLVSHSLKFLIPSSLVL